MILSTTWSEVILLHFISFVKNTDKDELIETYIFTVIRFIYTTFFYCLLLMCSFFGDPSTKGKYDTMRKQTNKQVVNPSETNLTEVDRGSLFCI